MAAGRKSCPPPFFFSLLAARSAYCLLGHLPIIPYMKTLLILILTVALLAAAFFTRPSEEQFQAYAKAELLDQSGNFFQRISARGRFREFMEEAEYKDRLLWVSIEKDGETLYTGAFAHWFGHGTLEALADAAEEKIADLRE